MFLQDIGIDSHHHIGNINFFLADSISKFSIHINFSQWISSKSTKDRNDDEIDKLEDQFQDPNSTASSPEASPPRLLPAKFAAPKVDENMLALMVAQAYQAQSRPIDPLQHVVVFNPTYEQLWAPIVGPAHPYTKDGIAQGMRNHKLGFVEDTSIEPFIFDEQYYTFHKYGYALTPLPPLAIIMSVILMPCKRMMPSLCLQHPTARAEEEED